MTRSVTTSDISGIEIHKYNNAPPLFTITLKVSDGDDLGGVKYSVELWDIPQSEAAWVAEELKQLLERAKVKFTPTKQKAISQ